MDTEQIALNCAHTLHRSFIDTMHNHFGVKPTYVENIEFIPLIFGGGYGIDPQPSIYINDPYLKYFDEEPPKGYFGILNLDTIVLHESAHHLHHTYHDKAFEDVFTLELVIDYSMIHYLQDNKMKNHIDNLDGNELDASLELYHKLNTKSNLKEILIADEGNALEICTSALGKNHKYLKEREECIREFGK